MNEDNLTKQEESVKKQEAMKRGTEASCLFAKCFLKLCIFCSQNVN